MKSIFKLLILSIFILVSCNKDYLELKPLDRFSEIDVFQDPVLIELYVNNIYSRVNHPQVGYGNGVLKAAFSDEVHDMWQEGIGYFDNCFITQDEIPDWEFENWNTIYSNIRSCNVFFEKIDNGKFGDSMVDGKPLKDRLTGEVHFLRAYLYHSLVSLWGGVPIIRKTYALTDDFQAERNSYAECINLIIEECDLAAGMLPDVNTGKNLGRATKGAALALKSEVLLYAASELHNNNTLFAGFSKPELLGYTSGDPKTRWQAAKNAAKAVIDLGLYGLYKPNPGPDDDIALNYSEIFYKSETEEDIYVRFLLGKYGGIPNEDKYYQTRYRNNIPLVSGPNGYHLWGQNTPTGDLVDDYEMNDGTPFSWDNPAQAAEPYKDRDPRFYGTILYEGAKWRPRPEDAAQIDPIGIIQVGTWEKWDAALNEKVNAYGLDTRNSPIEPYNGGYTGYYLRKFIDPSVNGQYTGEDAPWRYFRYTEILLNYAEACIELGEDGEARTYINMIRTRAGMPEINESGTALRERYRHERRIELALEDNRFYDIRRWVIGTAGYADATGVEVIYKLNPDNTTSTIPTIKPITTQGRGWIDKAYFFPIMRDEMNKNSKLVQNPGY